MLLFGLLKCYLLKVLKKKTYKSPGICLRLSKRAEHVISGVPQLLKLGVQGYCRRSSGLCAVFPVSHLPVLHSKSMGSQERTLQGLTRSQNSLFWAVVHGRGQGLGQVFDWVMIDTERGGITLVSAESPSGKRWKIGRDRKSVSCYPAVSVISAQNNLFESLQTARGP